MSRTGTCERCEQPTVAGKRGPIPKYCPDCRYQRRLEASNRWKDRNRDHIAAYDKEKYTDPEVREYYRQKSAHRRAARRDEIREYRRRIYVERQQATNTATILAWRAANPGKHAEIANRRRARLLGQFVAPVNTSAIRDRDNGLCGICGEPVTLAEQSLDHIIPIARGGTHEPANVQLAHRVCNSRKGARVTA
jgi:5-methylcytosine-specific restriction endonuclease McrA